MPNPKKTRKKWARKYLCPYCGKKKAEITKCITRYGEGAPATVLFRVICLNCGLGGKKGADEEVAKKNWEELSEHNKEWMEQHGYV